ncbi:carbohydrate kinase family protein [Lachnospiraceae bacterium 42-17]
MKVLSAGLAFCDIPLSPVPGNILEIDNSSIEMPVSHTGGDALTVAVVLSKLGIQASFAGKIGKDINGQFIRKELVKNGVNTDMLIEDDSYGTAVSYILIEESGERHFLVNRGANDGLLSRDIPDEAVREADLVFFGSALAMQRMTDGEIADLFKRAHAYGKITAMDASIATEAKAQRNLKLIEKSLNETDIFIPSYEEAVFFTGKTDVKEMLEIFGGFSLKILGIKLGHKGCVLTNFKETVWLSAYPDVKVVDTTGAGDCFMAGFLCGYLHGWDLRRIGEFASAVSAHGIAASGASTGIPDFETVLKYAKANGNKLCI